MKIINKTIIALLIITGFLHRNTLAQKVISGTISDAKTGEALPYIAVSLKKNLLSVATNESGVFDFSIPAEAAEDSLVVSSIGYAPQTFALADIVSALSIKLQPNSFELKEVMILPMPPQYYIKQAMNSIKNNYASKPFGTEAYYREKMTENGEIISFTEAVFNTFYPNYTDTAQKNAHQLLLYNKADKKKIAFMNKENKKRKKKKATAEPDTSSGGFNVRNSIGGPDDILNMDIVRGNEAFLDSTEFRWYEYEFAASSTYDNKELMVINFKSKRRIEHFKREGKIYIDLASNAIVSIDYTGDLTLPTALYPVLFMLGIKVEKPVINKKIEYQKVDDKWFPKLIQVNASLNLTKRHLFSENEHSSFFADGVFVANKLITENPKPVSAAKKFITSKKIEEQVHNDNNITWDQINVIKR